MVKQELLAALNGQVLRMQEDGCTIQSVELEFLGLEDDGLASRQTGIVTHLAGNAREALEAFCIGEAFSRKRLAAGVECSTQIKDTGDADMIRVPHRTSVQVTVKGDGAEQAMSVLLETAIGAAVMNQCQVRAVSTQ